MYWLIVELKLNGYIYNNLCHEIYMKCIERKLKTLQEQKFPTKEKFHDFQSNLWSRMKFDSIWSRMKFAPEIKFNQ